MLPFQLGSSLVLQHLLLLLLKHGHNLDLQVVDLVLVPQNLLIILLQLHHQILDSLLVLLFLVLLIPLRLGFLHLSGLLLSLGNRRARLRLHRKQFCPRIRLLAHESCVLAFEHL